MKTVNENLIRISAGLTPIPQELQLGDDIRVLLDASVTKIELKDNQDGTFNRVYVIKGIVADTSEGVKKEEW